MLTAETCMRTFMRIEHKINVLKTSGNMFENRKIIFHPTVKCTNRVADNQVSPSIDFRTMPLFILHTFVFGFGSVLVEMEHNVHFDWLKTRDHSVSLLPPMSPSVCVCVSLSLSHTHPHPPTQTHTHIHHWPDHGQIVDLQKVGYNIAVTI